MDYQTSQPRERSTIAVPKRAAAILLVLYLGVTATPSLGAPATDTAPAGPSLSAPTADAVSPGNSILAEYTPQAPPNPNPPPYTLLRFNENYRYLADPANRTDWFDWLKYIPLDGSDPNSYLSLGGDLRERYEHFTYPGFGVGRNPRHDDYVLQRADFNVDLHFNEHFRFFGQAISGIEMGGERAAPPTNQDPINLQQAFLDLRVDGSSTQAPEYAVARAGRFELSFGSGRLVATRQAPNIPFKFDGLQLIGAADDAKLYAFVTKPAREQKHDFDDEFPQALFWGVYGTTPPLARENTLRADIYYLGYRNDPVTYANGVAAEERHTFGTRLFGKIDGFDYDVEPIVQTGHFGDRQIFAWTVGSSAGYTFDNLPMSPRVGANLDVISGDTGHGHFATFNPLYFKAGYFNDASLLRPSNIIDVHPLLQLQALRSLIITTGSDVIWRYTTHDGLYGPSGNLELPASNTGNTPRYVATTAELAAQWQINRHLSWIGSFVEFFTGDYVHMSGGHDVCYFGTWFTFTW